MKQPRIQSAGDLEVVVLHESHRALADLIGGDLYEILGKAPDQQVQFSDDQHFDLFLIRLIELFVDSSDLPIHGETKRRWTLIEGLEWLSQRYQNEAKNCGLDTAVLSLQSWINAVSTFSFWCEELAIQIQFPLSRRELIWFGANRAKHNLLRLSAVLDKLDRKLKSANIKVDPKDTVAVLHAADEEARNRLVYHSTFILELLGELFISVNRLICDRFNKNPTNYANNMIYPAGVTSESLKNLYSSVLVFKRYSERDRIRPHVPATSRFLKLRY